MWQNSIPFDDKKYSSTTSRIQNMIKKIFKSEIDEYKSLNESEEDVLAYLKDKVKKTGIDEFISIANKIVLAVNFSKGKGADRLEEKLDKLSDYVNDLVEGEKASVDEVNPLFSQAAYLVGRMLDVAREKSNNLNK